MRVGPAGGRRPPGRAAREGPRRPPRGCGCGAWSSDFASPVVLLPAVLPTGDRSGRAGVALLPAACDSLGPAPSLTQRQRCPRLPWDCRGGALPYEGEYTTLGSKAQGSSVKRLSRWKF